MQTTYLAIPLLVYVPTNHPFADRGQEYIGDALADHLRLISGIRPFLAEDFQDATVTESPDTDLSACITEVCLPINPPGTSHSFDPSRSWDSPTEAANYCFAQPRPTHALVAIVTHNLHLDEMGFAAEVIQAFPNGPFPDAYAPDPQAPPNQNPRQNPTGSKPSRNFAPHSRPCSTMTPEIQDHRTHPPARQKFTPPPAEPLKTPDGSPTFDHHPSINPMNTTHTPGPWKIASIGSYGITIGDEKKIIGNVHGDNSESIDNARLIAALQYAAELIKTARLHFPKSVKNSDRFQLEKTCATINKAIHQATTA